MTRTSRNSKERPAQHRKPFQLDEGPSLSCLKSHAGSSEGSGIPKTEQGFKNKVLLQGAIASSAQPPNRKLHTTLDKAKRSLGLVPHLLSPHVRLLRRR